MTRKHMLALAVAATLVVAGTGAALASGSGSGHAGARPGFARGPQWPGLGGRLFLGPRGLGFGFVRPGLGSGVWQAAADYLGVSVSTLLGDLRSGKSLGDVADATSGKSRSDLIAALVAQQKSQLDKAVQAGKLTQAQEDKLTANLQQRITTLVDAKRSTVPMPRGFGRGPGFGFGFGGGRHGGWAAPPGRGANA
jgi:hypothetical protein